MQQAAGGGSRRGPPPSLPPPQGRSQLPSVMPSHAISAAGTSGGGGAPPKPLPQPRPRQQMQAHLPTAASTAPSNQTAAAAVRSPVEGGGGHLLGRAYGSARALRHPTKSTALAAAPTPTITSDTARSGAAAVPKSAPPRPPRTRSHDTISRHVVSPELSHQQEHHLQQQQHSHSYRPSLHTNTNANNSNNNTNVNPPTTTKIVAAVSTDSSTPLPTNQGASTASVLTTAATTTLPSSSTANTTSTAETGSTLKKLFLPWSSLRNDSNNNQFSISSPSNFRRIGKANDTTVPSPAPPPSASAANTLLPTTGSSSSSSARSPSSSSVLIASSVAPTVSAPKLISYTRRRRSRSLDGGDDPRKLGARGGTAANRGGETGRSHRTGVTTSGTMRATSTARSPPDKRPMGPGSTQEEFPPRPPPSQLLGATTKVRSGTTIAAARSLHRTTANVNPPTTTVHRAVEKTASISKVEDKVEVDELKRYGWVRVVLAGDDEREEEIDVAKELSLTNSLEERGKGEGQKVTLSTIKEGRATTSRPNSGSSGTSDDGNGSGGSGDIAKDRNDMVSESDDRSGWVKRLIQQEQERLRRLPFIPSGADNDSVVGAGKSPKETDSYEEGKEEQKEEEKEELELEETSDKPARKKEVMMRHRMRQGIRYAIELSLQRHPITRFPDIHGAAAYYGASIAALAKEMSSFLGMNKQPNSKQQQQHEQPTARPPLLPQRPNVADRRFVEEDFKDKNTFTLKKDEDKFVFREYAPLVFRELRHRAGFSEDDYVRSVCKEGFSDLAFSGKSGNFLYITKDNQFVLKTMPPAETKFLRRILTHYYEHLCKDGESLLTRFVGMYRMKMSAVDEVRFIVMLNIFATPKKIHERYDLKGSTVGRQTLFSCTMDKPIDALMLKDLDLIGRFRMALGTERKARFVSLLQRDAEFLASFGIIDYSLLLGVHFLDREENEPVITPLSATQLKRADGGIFASDNDRMPKNAIYYCAIIDILQPYNTKKVLEHNMKALVYNKDGISVCSPQKYVERFLRFITNYID
ncbi:Phosphatidylinositol-4-phosphate 5-kinase [Balamuthia mandrillaris]